MPITVRPSNKAAAVVDTQYESARTANSLTKDPFAIVRNRFQENGEVFQSSFPMPSKNCSNKDIIVGTKNYNGFVDTAVRAYSDHHHLVIRPDDVWMAILSQFNFFVNTNAEQLRHLFVAHDGKKELTIVAAGTRYTVDFGNLAKQMGQLIQENVVDPSLREWIMPEFTTTTENDVIISSVIMMSTVKKYFSYRIVLRCGIPSVTLLGERNDWEKMLERIEKLREYGEETTQWYSLLKPVLTGFVDSFNHPGAKSTRDFWQKIADLKSGASGPSYLSGWITAFCFFDNDGKSLYNPPSSPSIDALTLGGATFHRVDTNDVPSAFAEVPVLLDDNGEIFHTVMIAGLLGTRVSGAKKNTVQPQSAWWIADDIRREDDGEK